MAGSQKIIDDLLLDINGLQENRTNAQPSPLAFRAHARALQPLGQPFYRPPEYIDPELDTPVYDESYREDGLDDYDRSLLAEPYSRSSQGAQTPRVMGRLSLPGHTAPAESSDSTSWGGVPSRLPDWPNGGPRRGPYTSTDHSMQSPHFSKTDSSSLSDQFASSPTYKAGQRPKRSAHVANAGQKVARDPRRLPWHDTRPQDLKHSLDTSPKHVVGGGTANRTSFRRVDHIPVVQGIQLVPSTSLPDHFRSVFPFPYFNAIQSRCYDTAYLTQHNLVVSAPTGGGKTAVLELAICRLITSLGNDQFKVVYMAPIKSLCSERQRDWQSKFSTLGLTCAELTGDTDASSLRNVQSAHMIVTTPEKWDSVTRKWHDHSKLMKMVRLVLIDEVHILKDSRGATLEAVISRLKSVSSNMRFIALSATVPNSEDIAAWLGKSPQQADVPAIREIFGEEFRPVQLQKHVEGLAYRGNDFGFESVCDPILPRVIAKFSGGSRKPIIIFCITRKAAVSTAKLLAGWWSKQAPAAQCWNSPANLMKLDDPELKALVPAGVAFHHAGLELSDRAAIEKMFLERELSVICCTSTLAMGVNLPCHFVIIKNTVSYADDGLKEYSDLEVIQMLGRAGRPQFDTSAVAVIITKQEKVAKYEKLLSGQELLESTLHLNLIDHMNAEVVLRTIVDMETAKQWLRGTFLHVRLEKNPAHYKIAGVIEDGNLDDRVDAICRNGLELLEDAELIASDQTGSLTTTPYGDIMARFYVGFETMKLILGLGCQPKISDILSALAQAEEYRDIRLRSNEKRFFKEINRHNNIKFPIKVDLAMHAHKRSLILQSELGCIDLPGEEEFARVRMQFGQEKARLFACIHRLIRAVIDCQITKEDAVGVRNALELSRSLSARVWDSSPFQMKQIPQLGVVSVRKLAIAGINNLEDLELTEASRLEMILSKQPPFGSKIIMSLQAFPKLRVSLKLMSKNIKKDRLPTVKVKAEWGLMNDKIPSTFHKKLINVCLVTERSDGQLVDFRRTSSKSVGNGLEAFFTVELGQLTHTVNSYVMCDEIAGTLRAAELRPAIPAHAFPQTLPSASEPSQMSSRKLLSAVPASKSPRRDHHLEEKDEFDDNDLDDLMLPTANYASKSDFLDVDDFSFKSTSEFKNALTIAKKPTRLPNGKWKCNHSCKYKDRCKHLCCREGLDKEPKNPKKAPESAKRSKGTQTRIAPAQITKSQNRSNKILGQPYSQHAHPQISKRKSQTPTSDLTVQAAAQNQAEITNFVETNWYDEPISDDDEMLGDQEVSHATQGTATEAVDQLASSLPAIEDVLAAREIDDIEVYRKLSPESGPASGSREIYDKTSKPISAMRQRAESPESLYDAGASEIEEALIGMDDSTHLTWPQVDKSTSSEAVAEPPTSNLFLSTDSPAKLVRGELKRAMSETTPETQELKRPRRTEDTAVEALSSPKADKTEDSAPQLRPGMPSWVYELDPSIVAEYQDYLEFAV